MKIDVENAYSINVQANELFSRLLNGDIEWLSDEDKLVLIEHRKEIIEYLNTIFSREIPCLVRGEKSLDTNRLFFALQVARVLQASETFQWVMKLCYVSIEDLDDAFGDCFLTEELSYLLADTMNEWGVLKDIIENPDSDEFIQSACLDALVCSVAAKRINRLEIVNYFKSLFDRIIDGELDNDLLCTHLVSSCSDLWPGECLEEIRESFGLNLIEDTVIGIECVLENFSRGEEYCIERLQEKIKRHSFYENLPENPQPSDENELLQLDNLLQFFDQTDAEVNRVLKEPQRNEMCNCGSGRKYKKCCMNKPSLLDMPSQTKVEESVISYDPLGYSASDPMNALSEDERESILSFYVLVKENPEEVIQTAHMYIEKYPDIPMLYNFLYGAYRKLDRQREAIKLMKKTVQIFPDYLFGRVEYALYMLRRGEAEKAHEALGNVVTLSELYPERKVFHSSEWKAFSYAMGYYWIEKNDINQAKMYLRIIEKISPKSFQGEDLQKRMKRKLFQQFREKRKNG